MRRGMFLAMLAFSLVACEREVDSPTEPEPEQEPPETAVVPGVIGVDLSEARAQLKSAGLKSHVRTSCGSDNARTIIQQRPDAGSEVPPSTAVRLVAAVPLCPVPVVLLDPLKRAKRKLKARGFEVRIVMQADDLFDPGTVIDYRPTGDLRLGRVVTLVVAKASGPCDPSYPNVCIPPYPPDLNCDDVPYVNIRVIGSDPHGLDGYDNDGKGCET